jgi:hypothetical protein
MGNYEGKMTRPDPVSSSTAPADMEVTLSHVQVSKVGQG